jgi:hypothetical protein
MKSVHVLQKVKVLPRATASHQPGSETRWREETHVRSRVEQVSRVCMEPRKLFESRGPARDNRPGMPDPRVREARTVSVRWNAEAALSLLARQGGGHRGRRPDHAETGRTRERVRASSASCREDADQCRAASFAGSPPRDQRSPWKGPWPRWVDPFLNMRGRQGRRDEREREGPPEGREAVVADHRSEGSNGSDDKRTRASSWASPAWGGVCAGGSAAGKPGNQRRPWDLEQRR